MNAEKYKGKIHNFKGKTRKFELEIFEDLPAMVDHLLGAKLTTAKKVGKIKFSSFLSKKEYDCILSKKPSGKELYGENNVFLHPTKDSPARLDIIVFLEEKKYLTLSIHPKQCEDGTYSGLYFSQEPSDSELLRFYLCPNKFKNSFELFFGSH